MRKPAAHSFSVEESLYLNVKQKAFFSGVGTEHVLTILFFAATALMALREKRAQAKFSAFGRIGALMFIFSGIKESRFLIRVTVPQALNVSGGASERGAKMLLSGAVVLLAAYGIYTMINAGHFVPELPPQADLNGCRVMSDWWVYFYQEGVVAESLSAPHDFNAAVSEGVTLVLFNKEAYRKYLPTGHAVTEKHGYVIVAPKGCTQARNQFTLKIWPVDEAKL